MKNSKIFYPVIPALVIAGGGITFGSQKGRVQRICRQGKR